MEPNYVGNHINSAFSCSTYKTIFFWCSKFEFFNKIQTKFFCHPKFFFVMHSTSKSRTYMTTNIVWVQLKTVRDLMNLRWTQQKFLELRISVSRCGLYIWPKSTLDCISLNDILVVVYINILNLPPPSVFCWISLLAINAESNKRLKSEIFKKFLPYLYTYIP